MSADLFVVCKSCGSEVSAYITECPYCGTRLRKRAPKLDKAGDPPRRPRPERVGRRRPRLGRLRPGEMPGVRFDRRPYATLALVTASVLVSLALVGGLLPLAAVELGPAEGAGWWRLFTSLFAYGSQGYLLCAMVGVGLFGWLLERRHGLWAPLVVFFAGGAGGMLAASAGPVAPLALGGNGAALAMLGAWVVPDLRERRRGEATDSDLLGVAVIAVVLVLLPLAVPADDRFPGPDPVAGVAGALIGLALGLVLSLLRRGS
jgi:membrane associated rhomboid family serine protease